MNTTIACSNCGAKNRVDPARAAETVPVCGRCGQRLMVGTAPPSREPLVVTDASFERDVLGVAGQPVLVDCWAPWCGPCRMVAPTIDALAAEAGGRYVVAKLNTDDNARTAAAYRISSIPTLLIFRDGRLVDQLVGVQPKPVIAQRLAAHAE
ncbi:MAG TPA: thioredoxin [Tepidisphaeraceae bacterium]|nr:thioredoxin [Tepidisphaeraceae bacterium]